jgi:hypothetical protein
MEDAIQKAVVDLINLVFTAQDKLTPVEDELTEVAPGIVCAHRAVLNLAENLLQDSRRIKTLDRDKLDLLRAEVKGEYRSVCRNRQSAVSSVTADIPVAAVGEAASPPHEADQHVPEEAAAADGAGGDGQPEQPVGEAEGDSGRTEDADEPKDSRFDAECSRALQYYGPDENALDALTPAQKFYLVCIYWSDTKDSDEQTPAKIRKAFVEGFPDGDYVLPDNKYGTARVKTGIKRGAALVQKLTSS